MTVREELEWQEHKRLNPLAAFADQSRGRLRFEEPRAEDVRTCYQRDIDRIVHSKSFRRRMHKTQVFLQPEGDHYRTRMTHTLEVSRIAGTITRALGLNEDLAEAIAMGHDLGHTPFGHAGEDVLSQCLGKPFRHNEQSLRVVDILEKDGQGLNLTYEVRMGILGHTGDYWPETLEGQAVRRSDQIAYVNHDIDDAIRAGILTDDDIPIDITDVLGTATGTGSTPWSATPSAPPGNLGRSACLPTWTGRSRSCARSCLPMSTAIRWPRARRARQRIC